jgi:hypothetical protein
MHIRLLALEMIQYKLVARFNISESFPHSCSYFLLASPSRILSKLIYYTECGGRGPGTCRDGGNDHHGKLVLASHIVPSKQEWLMQGSIVDRSDFVLTVENLRNETI